ncbi:uncharacterized protein [Periplaneta americana]|uniref:uncharacterized protein isoform X1 n=1 Tax=Periplaneta americana TaxID=6978 RepID=UPI0037E9A0EF
MMRPFSVKDSGRKLSPHSDVREGDTEEEHIMAEAVTIEEIRAIESLHLPGSVETKSLTNIREALETEKTKYWHKFLKDYSDGPRTEEETDAIQMIYESIHFTDSTSSQDMLDKMMESQPFHENVIGRFAALKERRINLVYVRKIVTRLRELPFWTKWLEKVFHMLLLRGGTSKLELLTQYLRTENNSIQCMERIESMSKQSVTINQATAIRRMLEDSHFLFWLTVFHNIMPDVDTLFNQVQKRGTDALQIRKNVDTFQKAIQKESERMETVSMEVENAEVPTKKNMN